MLAALSLFSPRPYRGRPWVPSEHRRRHRPRRRAPARAACRVPGEARTPPQRRLLARAEPRSSKSGRSRPSDATPTSSARRWPRRKGRSVSKRSRPPPPAARRIARDDSRARDHPAQRRRESQPILSARLSARPRDGSREHDRRHPDQPVSHAHGQGYSDINWLMPELVSYVEFKKGTYYADQGDFSTAGSYRSISATRSRPSRIRHGRLRLRPVLHRRLARGRQRPLLYGVEVDHDNGTLQKPDEYQKFNGMLRYSRSRSGTPSASTRLPTTAPSIRAIRFPSASSTAGFSTPTGTSTRPTAETLTATRSPPSGSTKIPTARPASTPTASTILSISSRISRTTSTTPTTTGTRRPTRSRATRRSTRARRTPERRRARRTTPRIAPRTRRPPARPRAR